MKSEDKFWLCLWALFCAMIVSIAFSVVLSSHLNKQFVLKMAEQGYIQETKRDSKGHLWESVWVRKELE